MKTLRPSFISSFLISLALLGCSEDIDKTGASFTAENSGKPWEAERVQAVAGMEDNDSHVIQLIAEHEDGSRVLLSFQTLGLTPQQRNANFRERTATFTSFTGEVNDNYATVRWSTSSEQNVDYFEIQTSYDGFYFGSTEWVSGHWTTNSPNNYQSTFYISQSNADFLYVRLRVIDYISNDQFSEVLKLRLRAGVSFFDRTGQRHDGYDGTVNITNYDVANRYVSGTFQFKYKDSRGVEQKFSNGVFERVKF